MLKPEYSVSSNLYKFSPSADRILILSLLKSIRTTI